MAAGYYKEDSDPGFILKPEHLEWVDKKLKRIDANGELNYLVVLADEKNKGNEGVEFLETTDIVKLLTREDADELEGDEIQRIQIAFKPKTLAQPTVRVEFSRNGASVEVYCVNEEVARKLFDGLNKRFKTKVYKIKISWRRNIRTILRITSLVAGIAGVLWLNGWHLFGPTALGGAFKSPNPNDQLSFLNRAFGSCNEAVTLLLMTVPFFFFSLLLRKGPVDAFLARKFDSQFPHHVFYFGNEATKHDERTKRNVARAIAGLAVGLALTVLGGWLVKKL